MKIAIDASRAVNEKAGIGRYTRQLLENLLKVDKKNEYVLFFSYFRSNKGKERYIAGLKSRRVKIKTLKIPGSIKEETWRWRVGWMDKFLENPDVFFAPSFFEVNFGLKAPQVMTIHDLTTFLYPSHRGKEVSGRLSKRALEAAKKVKRIIAVSKATATDVKKFLKVESSKIEVIYPGNSKMPTASNSLPEGLKAKSYLLYVGTIEPRKNLIGLLKAYELLDKRLQEKYPLIICGAKGWNTGKIWQTYNRLKSKANIKFMGYLPDSILAKLFQEASIFVYPSVYEGFGLPVLEALGCGIPVITANCSSLPEVTGKAAVLINPSEPKTIAKAIQRLLGDSKIRLALGQKGRLQAKKFSWEKAAKETLRILEEVANE